MLFPTLPGGQILTLSLFFGRAPALFQDPLGPFAGLPGALLSALDEVVPRLTHRLVFLAGGGHREPNRRAHSDSQGSKGERIVPQRLLESPLARWACCWACSPAWPARSWNCPPIWLALWRACPAISWVLSPELSEDSEELPYLLPSYSPP